MTPNLIHPKEGGLGHYIKQSWQISKSASRAYWITLAITFIGMQASSFGLLTTFTIEDPYKYFKFMARSLIDTSWFFVSCHFVLRPFLKLKVLNRPLNFKSILTLVVTLFTLGIISYSGSFYLSKQPAFVDTDFHQMKLVNDNGEVDAVFSESMIWTIGILNTFTLFASWAIVYMLWHQHKSKKVLQQQMQQAQMQQLTNQLSPHFLFNTFNSIRALIYEDQDKAADTVTELAELFRTHLQAHLRVKSSLNEEWQVTEQYLGIEQIRLEERLSVNRIIDQRLWQQQLPTLTLLTLIENAIKHGISPSAEKGFININAEHGGDCWHLTVVNSFKPGSQTQGTQVGLQNVASRLQLTYGHHFSIDYDKDVNKKQFKVTITLPLD